jgi:hypothetical protein
MGGVTGAGQPALPFPTDASSMVLLLIISTIGVRNELAPPRVYTTTQSFAKVDAVVRLI